MPPQRPQWVAILTGAIALLLGIGYLVLVQFLDFRGEMLPAPVGIISPVFKTPQILAGLALLLVPVA